MMKLSWRYKSLLDYNHSNCARCIHRGSEEDGPQMCNPTEVVVTGPPWIKLTFLAEEGETGWQLVYHKSIYVSNMKILFNT